MSNIFLIIFFGLHFTNGVKKNKSVNAKKYFYTVIISTVLIVNKTLANPFSISDNLELYLITINPGNNIDEAWGHSAIYIKDIDYKYDYVFEYVSIETNNFVSNIKTLFGTDIYKLRLTSHHIFLKEENDRCITYQVIDLPSQQIQVLFNTLISELVSKQEYNYSIAYVNCSTLLYNYLTEYSLPDVDNLTIRDKLRYSSNLSILEEMFFIDIMLSSASDKYLESNLVFTPIYLLNSFSEKKSITSRKIEFKYLFLYLIAV
ncbi:lipoprotein N-acyltransferase Lnb domain-containing protein [Flammeovirga aprica]|uniref:DUF4105 domain-containing protein n=1 Tax=Flammeovirga aprica JL-4 TaxID=694437 RepID=A0A7X9RSE9_9BACT|nr:DUF4105 domain-containing protein [Flammeovirga aprica]NME67140.1 DUF4105 domain-containing protein [Flammeovirga aprica JL-4]